MHFYSNSVSCQDLQHSNPSDHCDPQSALMMEISSIIVDPVSPITDLSNASMGPYNSDPPAHLAPPTTNIPLIPVLKDVAYAKLHMKTMYDRSRILNKMVTPLCGKCAVCWASHGFLQRCIASSSLLVPKVRVLSSMPLDGLISSPRSNLKLSNTVSVVNYPGRRPTFTHLSRAINPAFSRILWSKSSGSFDTIKLGGGMLFRISLHWLRQWVMKNFYSGWIWFRMAFHFTTTGDRYLVLCEEAEHWTWNYRAIHMEWVY